MHYTEKTYEALREANDNSERKHLLWASTDLQCAGGQVRVLMFQLSI